MLRLYGGTPAIGWPARRISPSVGCSKPAIIRSVGVFPQPDGPSRLVNDPDGIARFIRSTATTAPKRFVTSISWTSGAVFVELADMEEAGAGLVVTPPGWAGAG